MQLRYEFLEAEATENNKKSHIDELYAHLKQSNHTENEEKGGQYTFDPKDGLKFAIVLSGLQELNLVPNTVINSNHNNFRIFLNPLQLANLKKRLTAAAVVAPASPEQKHAVRTGSTSPAKKAYDPSLDYTKYSSYSVITASTAGDAKGSAGNAKGSAGDAKAPVETKAEIKTEASEKVKKLFQDVRTAFNDNQNVSAVCALIQKLSNEEQAQLAAQRVLNGKGPALLLFMLITQDESALAGKFVIPFRSEARKPYELIAEIFNKLKNSIKYKSTSGISSSCVAIEKLPLEAQRQLAALDFLNDQALLTYMLLESDGYAKYVTQSFKLELINQYALIPDAQGSNPVFVMQSEHSDDELLVNILSPKTLNDALSHKNKNGECGWDLSLNNSERTNLMKKNIKKAAQDAKAFEATLTTPLNSEGETFLHLAIKNGSEMLKEIVNNISTEVLNRVCQLTTRSGFTVLDLLIKNRRGSEMISLFSKLSEDSIKDIVRKTNNKSNLMDIAAQIPDENLMAKIVTILAEVENETSATAKSQARPYLGSGMGLG